MKLYCQLKEHHVGNENEFGIELSSGYHDGGLGNSNSLYIRFMKHSWWFQIPQIIKPKTVWVDCSKYSWATSKNHGYWNHIRRDYGVHTFENGIHIHYGIQPGYWARDDKKNSDHTFVWLIPWLTRRYMGIRFYDVVNQMLLKTFPENHHRNGFSKYDKYEEEREFKDSLKKLKATFNDFDGEEIVALCNIEEREWRHGTGAFKWLSLFVKPTICRSLNIAFDKETGYEKGSWKGGIIGHSIDMLPGESAQSAFLRYAAGTDRYKHHGTMPRKFSSVRFDYE